MKYLPTSISTALLISLSTCFCAGENWPQWQGADRTNLSKENGLLGAWPANGPPVAWISNAAGLGYSGPAVVDGKLYTMGAFGNKEHLIALDTSTGKLLWKVEMGPLLTNGWGDGPRSTPSYSNGGVYAMSGTGILVCANASNGDLIWKKNLQKEFASKKQNWGYTESPLIDGDKVIVSPGSTDALLVALNSKTGDIIWQTNGVEAKLQYSSLVPATINGIAQYIQLFQDKIVGINANTGKLVWETPWPGKTAVIPTPVVKGNEIYITSGYKVGCTKIRINKNNQAEEVYRNNNMENHHGGVILLDDYIYGFSRGVVCQDFKTGEVVWNERSAMRKGAISYADGKLYLLEEGTGDVVLADASPKGWNELSRFTLSPQTEQRNPKGKIWVHPVISDGKLYLRDQEYIYCYNIKP